MRFIFLILIVSSAVQANPLSLEQLEEHKRKARQQVDHYKKHQRNNVSEIERLERLVYKWEILIDVWNLRKKCMLGS